MGIRSVEADARGPAGVLLVDVDLVGERVRLAGGDGRDVVLVRVDAGDDLHGRREEGLLHCLADFGALCASVRTRSAGTRGPSAMIWW